MKQSDIEPGDLVLEVNTRGDVSMYVLIAIYSNRAHWLELDGEVSKGTRPERKPMPHGVRLIMSSTGKIKYNRASELVEWELNNPGRP